MKTALREMQKLFISKEPLIFIAVIVLMSIFFGTWQTWDKYYSYNSYNELCQTVSDMEESTVEDFLAENILRWQAYYELEGGFELSEGSKEFIEEYSTSRKTAEYTGNYFFEAFLFKDVQQQYESIKNYSRHLEEIFKRAESMGNVSVFGNSGSYEMQNIKATARAYEKLKVIQPKFADTVGIKLLAYFSPWDILIIAAAIFGAYFLVFKERKSGELKLAAVTKNGKAALGISKLFSVFVWCLFSLLVIFAVRLAVIGSQYDLSAIWLPIQSVDGYSDCPYSFSAAEFIAISQGFKLIAAFVCAILFSFAFITVKYIVNICGSVILIVAEYFLFSFIDDFSVFSILKYFNIFSLLVFFDISETFKTANAFGQPISVIAVISAFSLLITAFLTVIFIWKFSKSDLNYRGLFLNRHKFTVPKISIFVNEAYRSFILNSGCIVLAVLTFASVYDTVNDPIYYEAVDVYYEQYLEKISTGKQTEEIISEEESLFEGCRKKLGELTSDYSKGSITSQQYLIAASMIQNELAREPALNLLKKQNDFISQNSKGDFVYYKKIEKFMNLDSRESVGIRSVLYMQMAVILIVCPVFLKFSFEENRLIVATAKGKKKLIFTRFLLTSLIALMIFIAVNLPQIISIALTVSKSDLSSALQSIILFRDIKTDLTIGNYFILLYLIRFAAAEISALMVAALCTTIKNKGVGYVVCSSILVFPEAFYFLISKSFSEIGIVFFAEGNLFLRKLML